MQHITVLCPKCHTSYRLHAEMVGKRMKCTNSVCRAPFEVPSPGSDAKTLPPAAPKPTGAAPASPPPVARHQSGSVGDLIPIIEAEPVAQEPLPEPTGGTVPFVQAEVVQPPKPLTPPAPPQPPSRRPVPPTMVQPAPAEEELNWRDAPPPPRRQGPTSPAAETAPPRRKVPDTMHATPAAKPPTAKPPDREPSPTPAEVRKNADGPVEVSAGAWAPPPVRRPPADGVGEGKPPAPTTTDADLIPKPASRRIAKFVWIAAAVGCVVLGTALYVAYTHFIEGDRHQFDLAHKLYVEGNFGNAAEKFRPLNGSSNAEIANESRFFADLCERLAAVNGLSPEIPKAFDDLVAFHQEHAEDSLLNEKPQPANLGRSFLKSAEDITDRAGQGSNAELLNKARDAVTWAERFRAEVGEEKLTAVRGRIDQVATQIDKDQRHRDVIAAIAKAGDDRSAVALETIDDILKRNRREFPDLDAEPKVTEALAKINAALRNRVRWTDGNAPPGGARTAEEDGPSLHVVPALVQSTAAGGPRPRVVLALARGVLYALDAATGRVQWTARVGIDTGTLPVRLPATDISPELVLVLSSDTNTLTARDVQNGELVWPPYRLSAPCLGRPVVVDRHVYVPSYDGKVHVLSIADGRLVGSYDLGQPLTVGGVHQEGTNFLYFPADKHAIFVLDTVNRQQPCTKVLFTGHPSGSLRSEPIIVSRDEVRRIRELHLDPQNWPDFLILSQADGLDATKLRAIPLSEQATGGLLPKAVETRIRGWTWFPPYHDGEQLVQVTDKGELGLVGIRQANNEDPDLFLEARQGVPLKGEKPQRGRAQVVNVVDDDLWVLAQGEMRYLHFNRYAQRLVDLLPQPLRLGSPLHAPQVDGKSLFVVTQSPQKPTCQATAVDAAAGPDQPAVRWRRHLGFLPQSEPLTVGPELVAQDEGGGLFAFAPEQHPREAGAAWQSGGRLIAGPPADGTPGAAYLLPSRDGTSALAVVSSGARTVIRRYTTGKPDVERPPVDGSLRGTPGVGDDRLVLPLADGNLVLVPFDPSKNATHGPPWRARDAEPDAVGYVTHLPGNEFLVTSGTHDLTHWHWSGGPDWRPVCTTESRTGAPLISGTITAPPLALAGGGPLRVLVAHGGGDLSLLEEQSLNGKNVFRTVRKWPPKGPLTAGPYVRDSKVFCVVNNETLVCVDPDRDGSSWEYRRPGEGIVGAPQQVGDLLLVAHRSGLYVGLDRSSGKPDGPGYRLKAKSVAPAVSPVPFGPGRAFAPLTDGTVLLLSLAQLRHPLRDFPPAW